MNRRITGTVYVEDAANDFKLLNTIRTGFFDYTNPDLLPEEDLKRRFKMVNIYAKSIELELAEKLGFDVLAYRLWRDDQRE